MLICTICHQRTPYDDVAALVNADRCVCLRCQARRTGERWRLRPELRRALSEVLAGAGHRSRHAPSTLGAGRGRGTRTVPRPRRAGRSTRAGAILRARHPRAARRVVPMALLPPPAPGTVRVWLVEFRPPRAVHGTSRAGRPIARGWARRTSL